MISDVTKLIRQGVNECFNDLVILMNANQLERQCDNQNELMLGWAGFSMFGDVIECLFSEGIW
jgi:hypothetical protein